MEILNSGHIAAKLKRIAYEIAERNYDEKELYLIGIKTKGTQLANILAGHLKNICEAEIKVSTIILEKRNPLEETIKFAIPLEELDNKVVILVDDVANTGRTFCYAIKPLLEFLPKKIQVAVLIDRMHKLFPIQADYVGVQLSTSMQDYVKVTLDDTPTVYLE